jgi:hypothetical protein
MSAPEVPRAGIASESPVEAPASPDRESSATTAVGPGAAHRRIGAVRARLRGSGRPLDLGSALLAVLGTWLASRVAVVVAALLGARTGSTSGENQPGLIELWDRWDVGLFVKVARYGYLSPAYADRTEVDLPGLPIAMRLVHPFVGDWVLAGMVVSLLAGLVAAAALYRLAVDDALVEGNRSGGTAAPEDLDRGRRAVLLMVCFPYAVFLFAGYSEALFAAFATTAWVAVRRERWLLAGLLTAGATATRVLGLALLAAVWVEYLVTRWRARTSAGPTGGGGRRAGEVGALLLPVAPLVAFGAYFQARTGHWDAYTRAMREHWGRTVAPPWEGFLTTWRAAVNGEQASSFQVFWWAEILAVLIGIVLGVVLLRRRRWGEATFVLACTAIMSCSSYWASGVRAVLVWFPLYLVLARRREVLAPYLWVCAPAAVVFVVAFTSGAWVD